MSRRKDARSVLIVVAALALLAIATHPLNLILNAPRTYYSGGDIWIGSVVAATVVLLLTHALWRGDRWARWAFSIVLMSLGAFVFLAVRDVRGDGSPQGAYLVVERIRGLLLLALSLVVFSSGRIDAHVSDIDDEEEQDATDRPTGESGPGRTTGKDGWLTTGTILAGLWFCSSAYSLLYEIYFLTVGQAGLITGGLPPAMHISLTALMTLSTGASTWAFMSGANRTGYNLLRYSASPGVPVHVFGHSVPGGVTSF